MRSTTARLRPDRLDRGGADDAWKLILAGLAFHARMNFATACGVAAAAAVLTGALLWATRSAAV